MPGKAPRICRCGHRVAAGVRCECEVKRDAERKARFDQKRPSSSARGYTSTWEKQRAAYLMRNPACAFCGALATVVDHKTPHKGDMGLFWDVKNNWQPLCRSCHNSTKQRAERRAMERK